MESSPGEDPKGDQEWKEARVDTEGQAKTEIHREKSVIQSPPGRHWRVAEKADAPNSCVCGGRQAKVGVGCGPNMSLVITDIITWASEPQVLHSLRTQQKVIAKTSQKN